MFDWYEPQPPLKCPVCSHELREWQGKDGPCALLAWRQGYLLPLEQRVEPECKVSPWPNPNWRLPQEFTIYSHECGCPFPAEAICNASTGTWNTTDLVTAQNARQHKHETRQQWHARQRWLLQSEA